ncbi:Protein MEI2-like 2 [Nosema granulosis]|uniref:Protein MEI2-like 2 n=1 Tax=Nosema granulosis TaxID=83296 RepID=A0A9P6GYR5_9MICR|nr:Protein MEI2-like 2 [Nosema granulosis]
MDKPTRTLVIVGDSKTLEKIASDLKNKPDVREIYKHQRFTNALVAIFYDIRKAEAVYKDIKSTNTVVYYSISKYEVPQEIDKCDESRNQGTVYITLKNNRNVNEKEFMKHISSFGEIKEIKLTSGLIKCVEFFDTRSASKIREALNNKSYGNCSVSVRNVWDLNSKTRTELLNRVEQEIQKIEVPDVKKRKITNKKTENIPFGDLFDEFIVENLDKIILKIKR